MNFQRIVEQVYFRPWYITRSGHASVRRLLESRLLGKRMSKMDTENDDDIINRMDNGDIKLSDMVNTRPALSFDADRIAHIHIFGPLGPKLSKIERACGATGYEQLQADFVAATAGGARGVLLHVDSPGGTVAGCAETARALAELNSRIPVIAHGDLIASAAYYVAAGCTQIVMSESGDAGSIGVLIPYVDTSAELEELGLKPDPIVNSGGDLKALGHRGFLNDTEREYLQHEVDRMFQAFRSHVLQFRGIPDEAMRGQTLGGQEMLSSHLADAIGTESFALELLRSRLK